MTAPDAFSLTRLFVAPNSVPAPATLTQDWVGGIMLTWDPVSFANTVRVGPVVYTNLPVCSPNGLTLGTVLLAKAPGGYIVVGMLGSATSTTLLDPIRYRALRADLSNATTTFTDAGVLNFLLNINTQYAVDGCLFYNTLVGTNVKFSWNGPPNMAAKWSAWGTQDTSFTHLLFDTVLGYGDANPQEIYSWGHSAIAHPRGWFATSDTPGLLQLRFAQNTANATAALLQQGSWLRITELGPASGAQTFIKLYTATGSRSYDKNGAYIGAPDGDNNMYMGQFNSRSFGGERHMWTFPAATMRTDLAGATVLSARMYLYCFKCDSAQGDYNWFFNTAATIQTTFPTSGFGGTDVQNLWSVGAWASFDITAQMDGILTRNANSVLGGPAGFNDASTAFRGFGTGGYQPYIEITYAI
ncbi:MAG: hypothetical protein ACRDQU_00825 [Pseudonocardiaceae bacterium]